MQTVYYIILFILGTAFGSFLNVLAYRYPLHQKFFTRDVLRGRSHCPKCNHPLKWFELIPLFSFVIQGRHCRYCKEEISWRYPAVEIVAGLMLILLYWRLQSFYFYGFWWLYALWALVFSILFLIALVDIDIMIIPNSLNMLLLIVGVLLYASRIFFSKLGVNKISFLESYSFLFGEFGTGFFNYLLTGIGFFLLFFLLVIITKERMFGMGDVKLMGALGFIFGWPDMLIVANFAFILGSLILLPFLIFKKKSLKELVPFGPFLSLASFAVAIAGANLFNFLFRLI